ncbi:MAG: glycosyltransferase, partial [Acidimicrobiales bacterium]
RSSRRGRRPGRRPGARGGSGAVRVLVVHNRYRSGIPSGEDHVVDREREALTAAGHTVERFERHSDDIAGMSALGKARIPLDLVWNRGAAGDLDRAVTAFGPDVVHVHNVFPLLSASVLRRCLVRGVPCVVTLHNYRLGCPGSALYRDGAPCRRCVGRRLAVPAVVHGCYRTSPAATLPVAVAGAATLRTWRTAPSAYLFLSEALRRELAPLGLPAERCFVKGNFVEPAPARGPAEPLVAYLGRLTEEKGLRVLMAAWDRYRAARSGAGGGLRLAVAGTGPLEGELRAWAAGHRSVELLGLLDRAACADLVGRARAVMAPSEWPEPFGLVVAEAMAAGTVPVATAHGAFADMVADGVDGRLYPPGDTGALAGILADLEVAPPEELAAMGAAARATHRRRFAPAGNVELLEAAYRFAVEHPRRRVYQAAAPALSTAHHGRTG